jgi:hypothetical protein
MNKLEAQKLLFELWSTAPYIDIDKSIEDINGGCIIEDINMMQNSVPVNDTLDVPSQEQIEADLLALKDKRIKSDDTIDAIVDMVDDDTI